MGMDVVGRKPTTKEGECFRIGGPGWHPIADYCIKVAPDIAARVKYWHSNDGDGLDESDSIALSDVLQKEIDSGRLESYARIRESELELLPNVPCPICRGAGTCKPHPEFTEAELKSFGPNVTAADIKHIDCGGSGFVRPWASMGWFAVDRVREFATFLRGCGGFQIW